MAHLHKSPAVGAGYTSSSCITQRCNHSTPTFVFCSLVQERFAKRREPETALRNRCVFY